MGEDSVIVELWMKRRTSSVVNIEKEPLSVNGQLPLFPR